MSDNFEQKSNQFIPERNLQFHQFQHQTPSSVNDMESPAIFFLSRKFRKMIYFYNESLIHN